MSLDIKFTLGVSAELEAKIDKIVANTVSIMHMLPMMEGKLMASLDEILADVTEETTTIASVQTLLDGLQKQIADALSGVVIAPTVQAKIDAVFSGVEANKAALAAAIAASTPAAITTVDASSAE